MSADEQTSAIKATETVKKVKDLVRGWYRRAQEMRESGGHTAWIMFAVPAEILLAMDVVAIGTEQYSAACAAKQAVLPFCERAEAEGYSLDICGYERAGFGYAARHREEGGPPTEAPYGGLPRPDFAIGRTYCEPGYKWYQAIQRYLEMPVFIYDVLLPWPDSGYYREDPDIAEQYIGYYRQTLHDLVVFLEHHTGKKLDYDRLREAISISQETRRVWYEIQQMRKAIPSPMPTTDVMSLAFPGWTMEGTPEALEFFQELHREVEYRVENKISVVPEEKYRLMWTGLPPWYHTAIFNEVYQYGAVFVIEYIYFPPEPVELDLTDPIAALAKRDFWAGPVGFCAGWPKRGEESYGVFSGCYRPVNMLLRLVKEYQIDGVVMPHIVSCRNHIIGHIHARNILQQFNIPTLVMHMDMTDTRSFNPSEIASNIETFMEILRTRKASIDESLPR